MKDVDHDNNRWSKSTDSVLYFYLIKAPNIQMETKMFSDICGGETDQ